MFYLFILLILYIWLKGISKSVSKTYLFILALMVLIIVCADESVPDYSNYLTSYDYLLVSWDSSYKDAGYGFLAYSSKLLGLSYKEFRIVYSLIALLIIDYAIGKITRRKGFILIFYFATPFLLNVVQVRNFMVQALLLLAMVLCFDGKHSTKKYIIWCVIIFIASSQHIIAILYLPVIFLFYHRNLRRLAILCVSVFSVGFVLDRDLLESILNRILTLYSSSRAEEYLQVVSRWGFLLYWLQIIALVYVTYNIYKLLSINKKPISIYNVDYQLRIIDFSEKSYKLMLCSVLYFPLFIINGNFARLIQNFSIIQYCEFYILCKYCKPTTKKEYHQKLFLQNILICLLIYDMQIIWIELWDYVVVPLLTLF